MIGKVDNDDNHNDNDEDIENDVDDTDHAVVSIIPST